MYAIYRTEGAPATIAAAEKAGFIPKQDEESEAKKQEQWAGRAAPP
jgi:hypothetical protein